MSFKKPRIENPLQRLPKKFKVFVDENKDPHLVDTYLVGGSTKTCVHHIHVHFFERYVGGSAYQGGDFHITCRGVVLA